MHTNTPDDTFLPFTQAEQIPASYECGTAEIDSLYEIYNENAKYFRQTMSGIGRRINAFLTDPRVIRKHLQGFKDYSVYPLLSLPAASLPLRAAVEVMRERRSSREFTEPVTLNEIASVLKMALAANRTASPTAAPEEVQHFRPYSSGGGLYPIEFYMGLINVEGVKPSLAHYDARLHQLRVLRSPINPAEFEQYSTAPPQENLRPALAVFVTGVFQRSVAKYGLRGYKLSLIEAGAACQNLQLAATALGLQSLVWASYYDAELERFLGIDGVTESAIVCVLIGRNSSLQEAS